MNTDKLSLVIMATGPRGSLKTLFMTAHMSEQLLKSYYNKKYGKSYKRIFSNYPVGFWYKPIDGDKAVYLSPEPLNMEALIVFDKELSECYVYIDEIDQWMDKQEWQAVSQKLIMKASRLIRHRMMSMFGTLQSFDWLNSRLQFQTDIMIRSRDLAFSPWGREHGLGLGEQATMTWFDNSGIMTGYTYKENPTAAIRDKRFTQGRRYWNCYDTSFEFDVLASSTKYKVKSPLKEIDFAGGGREVLDPIPQNNNGTMNGDRHDPWYTLMSHAVEQLRSEGNKVVSSAVLWDAAQGLLGAKGINMAAASSALSRLGVKKNGSRRSPGYILVSEESQRDGRTSRDADEFIRNSKDERIAV